MTTDDFLLMTAKSSQSLGNIFKSIWKISFRSFRECYGLLGSEQPLERCQPLKIQDFGNFCSLTSFFWYFLPQYLTNGICRAYLPNHFLKELNKIFQVDIIILPTLWLIFCYHQWKKHKMTQCEILMTNEHIFFIYTLSSICLYISFLLFETFTVQFHGVFPLRYVTLLHVDDGTFWYMTCFVPNLIVIWPRSRGLNSFITVIQKNFEKLLLSYQEHFFSSIHQSNSYAKPYHKSFWHIQKFGTLFKRSKFVKRFVKFMHCRQKLIDTWISFPESRLTKTERTVFFHKFIEWIKN